MTEKDTNEPKDAQYRDRMSWFAEQEKSIRERQEPIKGLDKTLPMESVEESWRKVLDQVLEIAVEALGDIPEGGQRYDYVKRLEQSTDWRDIAGASRVAADSAPEMEGLRGPLSLLVLQVRREIEERAERPERLRTFLSVTLRQTLARLEREGEGTWEDRVDLVLMPLAQYFVPACTGNLRRFVAGLRGYMERQPERERGEGWFQTVAVMGDWLGRAEGRDCLLQGVHYYHQVLSSGSKVPAERIRIVANNLAGRIDDLRGEREEKYLRVCNRVHALSVAATLFGLQAGDEEEKVARELWASLTGEAPVHPFLAAKALLTMANVPTSWSYLDQRVAGEEKDHREDWMMLLEASAGPLGARLNAPADYRRIGATFFNAGVSALRMEKARLARGRVLLNSLGLFWSLRKCGNDGIRALVDYNGLDCAVNLFGALSDLPDVRRLKNIQILAQMLAAWRTHLPQEKQLEYLRLEGSWGELGLTPVEDGSRQVDMFYSATLGLLLEILGEGAQSLGLEDETHAALATGRIVGSVLREALGGSYHNLIDELLALCDKVVTMSQDLTETWTRLYGNLADPSPTALGRGPLVEAGILTEAEWQQQARDSLYPNITSLADWLAVENLGWSG